MASSSSKKPTEESNSRRSGVVGPILREGRRTHCLPMLVLAEAVSRNSHHRRNQATARIRAVNQIH
jgi:hypothetical protein